MLNTSLKEFLQNACIGLVDFAITIFGFLPLKAGFSKKGGGVDGSLRRLP